MSPKTYIKKPSTSIPKEKCLDSTINLLTEGYLFIPNRMRKYNTTLFQTRLMGKKAICLTGKEAAELFYNQNLFTREGAIPRRIQQTLFGKKAIQTLDGSAHMQRKMMFMSMMSPLQIDKIIMITKKQWQLSSRQWEKKKQVVLFDEVNKLFFQVACKWVGVSLNPSEVKKKAKDMCSMIDAFGAIGPRHWKGRCSRNRSECWAKSLINDVRAGRTSVPKDTVLYSIAWHKDLSNNLLDPEIAGIELINILRPITAIATYVIFGVLSLLMYPESKRKLQLHDRDYPTMFTQEVRRYYPFGPFLGARVRNQFNWHNHNFREGDLVFLDIYGTNHDKQIWGDPYTFRPERFKNLQVSPFDFIPQGGGDCKTGTRCPGEGLTIVLMKVSFDFLVNNLDYQVPLQDLTYKFSRIPAIPKSRFIISNVKNKIGK